MEEVDKGCLMIRIQDGCEWVNVSSGTGPVHPGSPGQRAVKQLCVCVFVWSGYCNPSRGYGLLGDYWYSH